MPRRTKLDPRRSVTWDDSGTKLTANQNPAPTKSKTVQTNPSTAQNYQQTAPSGKKTSGRKRLYLYGAIGVNLIIVIIGLCWWIFSGDDETKEEETQLADANKEVEPDTSEKISSDDSESASNTPSIPDTPLIERIPSDAGAVLLIRINDLLEKDEKISPPCPSRIATNGG